MFSLGSIAAWFATSKVGRAAAACGAIALVIGIALLKAVGRGKEIERAKQDKQSLKNLRSREELHNEVTGLRSDDLDRRGRRWVRDE